MTDLEEISAAIRKFRDERDWMQFHSPKNLACSIAIEAAELLEQFQWDSLEESEGKAKDRKSAVTEEVADVAIYLIELADNLGIDLVTAIREKLVANGLKYPANKARGNATKYSSF
jgi:NTP pyrophosphatase (non-canonical NTP hydrolase)